MAEGDDPHDVFRAIESAKQDPRATTTSVRIFIQETFSPAQLARALVEACVGRHVLPRLVKGIYRFSGLPMSQSAKHSRHHNLLAGIVGGLFRIPMRFTVSHIEFSGKTLMLWDVSRINDSVQPIPIDAEGRYVHYEYLYLVMSALLTKDADKRQWIEYDNAGRTIAGTPMLNALFEAHTNRLAIVCGVFLESLNLRYATTRESLERSIASIACAIVEHEDIGDPLASLAADIIGRRIAEDAVIHTLKELRDTE